VKKKYLSSKKYPKVSKRPNGEHTPNLATLLDCMNVTAFGQEKNVFVSKQQQQQQQPVGHHCCSPLVGFGESEKKYIFKTEAQRTT
jgi:hypothetical protein